MASPEDDTLLTAALEGDLVGVRRALANGASPAATDSSGWSALHNAMLAGAASLPIATALIENGACVNATTVDGLRPLHLCHEADPKVDWKVSTGATSDGRTSFFAACVQTEIKRAPMGPAKK